MILLHRLTAHNFKQLTDVSLCFPDRGTILIEGANEAGKSSLFEAVFFALYGRGLITDRDFGMSALRKYGEEELRVELEFSIAGRRFHIARRVGSNQTVTLTCPREDGTTEIIRKNTPAQERLEDELRLSAAALLNTCFVGQKDLGRLEDMDGPQRKAAINELLNLKVLTDLEINFKVTADDQNGVKLCRERLAVADLDSALPALEQAAQAALNCWHYAQWRQEEARWRQGQQNIETVVAEREKIARERNAIAAKLEDAARLHQRIHAMENALTLRARAWRDAAVHQERARQEWETLSALSAALPGRVRHQAEWHRLAESLATLETLEAEAQTQRGELQEQQDRIAAYNRLLAEWKAGGVRLQTLHAERDKRQKASEEADQHLDARNAMNRRDAQLAHFQQQITTWETAMQEAEALQAHLNQTRLEVERLPHRLMRREQLTILEARERQAAQDRQEYVRAEREWAELQQKQRDRTARVTRIAMLESEHTQYAAEEAKAQEAEQYAASDLRGVQARLALLDWTEAMERVSQANPSLPRLKDIQARQEKARQELAERAGQQRESAKRVFASASVLSAGVLLGAAGAVVSVLLAVTGLAVAVAGLVFCIHAQKMRRMAQSAEGETRRQCDQLEGERQGAQAVLETEAEQAQHWARRAADCRRLLEQQQITVPESPEQARAQITSLPNSSLFEAQEACRAAETAKREAANRTNLVEQTLQHERRLAQQEDPDALDAQEHALTTARAHLCSCLKQAQDLPQLRRALELSEQPDALRDALQTAAREVADSESAQAHLPNLQSQQDAKTRSADQLAREISDFAHALQLPGEEITVWNASAQQERETIRESTLKTPTATLQHAVDQARQALTNAEKQVAALDSNQARRKAELDADSLSQLEDQASAIAENISRNVAAREVYGNLRPTLRAAGLPDVSLALGIDLAAKAETLRRDQEQALRCTDAEVGARKAAQTTLQHREETLAAWHAHCSPAPLPDTPASAEQQLPPLREAAAQELAALDEPTLLDTDLRLQERDAELTGDARAWQQEQAQARARQQHLREQMGADPNEELDTLPVRLSELAQADAHDVAGWEVVVQECREAIRDNRSARNARAETLGITETILDKEVEKRDQDQATRSLEVKRCAGEVVARTRQSIVSRVMPLTEQNMRLLLPLLTEGRYQDVKWEEALNAIVVYDQRAREFQRKRVFSGGAKDQISLALRMAFALATLPGEHNVRPGFLFLDEPLSSFDRPRTRALVDLLTRGLISQKFEQVFLVSHSEAFDPGCFAHRLRMESGRVCESTL